MQSHETSRPNWALLPAVRVFWAPTGPCSFLGVISLGKHPISSSRQLSSQCYLLEIYLTGMRRVEMFEVWTAVKVVSGRVGKWWIAAWEQLADLNNQVSECGAVHKHPVLPQWRREGNEAKKSLIQINGTNSCTLSSAWKRSLCAFQICLILVG